MAITLIFGESGTGKSEYCQNTMLALHGQGAKTMMIVPEQFAHSAEAMLIERNGFITDGIEATSFKRLAHRVLQKNGLLKGSITSIGKSMLLAKAVLGLSKDLTLYREAALRPGFVEAALSFIADCKRSSVSPEQLLTAADGKNAHFSMKISELSSIYKAYQTALDTQYTDGDDYVTLLSQWEGLSDLFRGVHIFVDEFVWFSRSEFDCLCALAKAGADLYVTLGAASAEKGGIFEPVSATAHQLTNMAKTIGVPLAPSVYLTEKHRFIQSDELAHFEAEYHRYPPKSYPHETKNLSLYIAPDLYTEVQALAAAICQTVQERGFHYRDIAIIAGDVSVYADLIKTVFPVYNIPVFIDQKRPLLSHPIIVMLASLLDIIADGLETESLLAYCKTGYSGLSLEETDLLENFALAGRLKRKDWLNDSRFLKRADSVFYQTENLDESHGEEAARLLNLRDRLMKPIQNLQAALSESKQVAHRAAAIFSFLEEIKLYQTVQTEIDFLKAEGNLQQAKEHGEIYNLLITLLDELVICLGEEQIGLERLRSILLAGLGQCEMSTIPPAQDQVFFGDTARSLVKNVKALFVIGAKDNAFPAPPAKEGILKDDERRFLSDKGIVLGPDAKKVAFHNQYQVYNALNISHNRMYVSYAVADHEGKGLRPSPLIDRLRKLFPYLTEKDNLSEGPDAEQIIAGKASAWQYMLEHFKEETPAVLALKIFFENDEDYSEAYGALLRHRHYTSRAQNLSPAIARALYGTNLRGSVSQLERYSNCPFSYFMQYGLRAKERKILKIDAPDVGSLLHKLVEVSSLKLQEQEQGFASLTEESAVQLADQAVNDLFTDIFIKELYSENRLAALIRQLKASLAKMLMVLSTHVKRGEFEPCAFEVAFDKNGELPPVTLSLPTGETITLIGRIDRIDMLKRDAKVYIKIIDYKTGSKTFSLSDIYNRLSLQLAVYLIATEQGGEALFGAEPAPAGMFYFRLADQTIDAAQNGEDAMLKQFKMSGLLLKDADIVRAMDKGISGYSAIIPAHMKQDGTLSEKSGSYATMEQFNKLKQYVKKTAGKIGAEILKGGSAIYPCKNNQGLPCRYCKYHAVCSFDPEKDRYRIAHPLKDEFIWSELENDLTP